MNVDLAPTLLLVAKGAVIAAVPLAVVWFSRGEHKARRLAWLTAFLTFDLILFGAFTRLTDSGLGCPDWPGCYGHSNPLSAGEQIRAAQTALPSGPVTMGKAWIEMIHRYFAMGVGALIVVLMALAWARWRREPQASPWLATLIFVAVCVQGAFGALTVTMKLQPAIVTLHLLGGVTLLALLVWLALRESPPMKVDPAAAGLRGLAVISLATLYLQIALGGWVSSNYAVLACTDFPLCQGRWLPDADFAAGYALWRPLGMDSAGSAIPFQALVAIHWTHRTFALLVFAVLGVLARKAWRLVGLERLARGLAALLVLQFLTGLSNIVLDWPLLLAVMHNGGAAALVAVLVVINLRCAQAARRPLGAASQVRLAG